MLTSDSKLTLAYVFDQLVNLTGFEACSIGMMNPIITDSGSVSNVIAVDLHPSLLCRTSLFISIGIYTLHESVIVTLKLQWFFEAIKKLSCLLVLLIGPPWSCLKGEMFGLGITIDGS